MKKEIAPSQTKSHPWLDKKVFWHVTPAWLIICFLMGVSLLLHLVNISAIGDGNLYYTAAVKSMLQSWDNFFFAAAEPGGSVSVDKPPLGLWIEALFAYIFGVNGISVSLPNILSGVLSIPVLFHLVKKYFGSLAGVTSGIVYIATPIVLAVDRNNTIDGMLVFILLLAAWAFIKAADTGKLWYLIIGAVLVGLGFNIKMLQAYLVLPAFLLLFLLGTKIGWGKRILYISIALLVILSISLSWALIVDLTPSEERPYVGSSEDNSVMELIFGHNGLARLFGKKRNGYSPQNNAGLGQNPGNLPKNSIPPQNPSGPNGRQPSSNQPLRGAQLPQQNSLPPQNSPGPNGGQPPLNQSPRGAQPPQQPGGNAFSKETGSPGIFRLFQAPLGKEMSWLLPFALFGMVMLAFSMPMSLKNMSSTHKGVILWGGWMLTCLVFFSMADFFHAYYMIMLAPPLSALVGAGLAWFTNLESDVQWKKGALVFALLLTLIFQVYLALDFISFTSLFFLPIGIFLICAAVLLFTNKPQTSQLLSALLFISVLLIPLLWTVQIVLTDNPHTGLPSAYAGESGGLGRPPADKQENPRQKDLLDFLMANTDDIEYLVAVSNANTGAPFVLATGRPVLYMGGFTGSDPVIDADGLRKMVAAGDLRYVFYQNIGQEKDQAVNEWLRSYCQIVEEFSAPPQKQQDHFRPSNQPAPVLFDCD